MDSKVTNCLIELEQTYLSNSDHAATFPSLSLNLHLSKMSLKKGFRIMSIPPQDVLVGTLAWRRCK